MIVYGFMRDTNFIRGTFQQLNEGYVCAGNGFYVSGKQDGTIPPHGWHIPGEMSGIWMQPIKLMNSYNISCIVDHEFIMDTEQATYFTQYPWGNEFVYENEGYSLVRREWIVDDLGLVIELENRGDVTNEFSVSMDFVVNLRGSWLADQHGMWDDFDECQWNDIYHIFLCNDLTMDRFLVLGTSLDKVIHSSKVSNQVTVSISFNIMDSPNVILITGSIESKEHAIERYLMLKAEAESSLDMKLSILDTITETAKISIPDKKLEITYQWSKYNVKWLYNEISPWGAGNHKKYSCVVT